MCEHPLAYDLNRLDDRLLVDASCSGHRRVRQREIAMHFVRCRRTTDQRTNLASVDHAITTLRARASWRNTFTRLVRVFSCQGLNRPGNCTQSSSIDSLVIALNVYEIPYADFDSPRYVTRALYGIGNQVLRIALTDNPKIVDSTYEQVVSIPKLSTGAPVGGVLRTTRSPHGFCCMRLPLSCFEQSFSQRLTHVRAVQFVTA